MATKLDKTLKREIDIDGQAYMVAISPEGVKLTQKGYRKGREMTWRALWSGGTEEGASTSGAATSPGEAQAPGAASSGAAITGSTSYGTTATEMANAGDESQRQSGMGAQDTSTQDTGTRADHDRSTQPAGGMGTPTSGGMSG
jgi:hypothetical protein